MEAWALVAGFGNPLMGDDGVGPKAIELIGRLSLPAGVDTIDAGTSALDLVPHLEGKRLAVFIDAVQAGGEAGTIYRLTPEDIAHETQQTLSLHSLRLRDALLLWELQVTRLPEIVVLGIEPRKVDLDPELSPEVEAALPQLYLLVKKELESAEQK